MNRREALKTSTIFVGGAILAASGVLEACATRVAKTSAVLGPADQDLFEEIADTLLPTTASSPGAKAAGVGAAVNLILTDCYDAKAQRRVVDGLKEFRATCRRRGVAHFVGLPRAQRERLLRDVDAEARKAGDSHYYRLVRELAEGAYWSSETGMTKALRYVRTPGRWVGCVPLEPGQPAWG